ncbi:unnamed protein product [Mytilus coruscus]|uniref:Uncharacterized protein n=1 Tax=Mytilus coruscus TaxID=42192 RepID=A0A6J8DZZ0_MYTCO|nr:unnamed protein product [Mytilus coruscus]
MSLAYLKGLTTRYKNLLEVELGKSEELLTREVSDFDLESQIRKVNKSYRIFDEFGPKFEETLERLSLALETAKAEKDLKTFQKKKEKYKTLSKPEPDSKIEQLIEIQMQMMQQMQSQNAKPQHDEQNQAAVQLPKLQIMGYNGDKQKFKEFWDQFEVTVHKNTKLSNVEKISYLKSKLHGTAQSAIPGLQLSNENYDVAIDILKDRFGDIQNAIERNLRSLEALNQNIDQDVFISMITTRLPEAVLVHLEIQKGSDKWAVEKLRDLLKSYIAAREAAESRSKENTNDVKPQNRNSPRKLKLKVESVEEVSVITFASDKPKLVKTEKITLQMKLADGTKMKISANVVSKITGSVLRRPISVKKCQNYEYLWNNFSLADTLPTENEKTTIELLIGSKFGWIITGRTSEKSDGFEEPSMLILNHGTNALPLLDSCAFTAIDKSMPVKPPLEDFWNLETIGISEPSKNSNDTKALEQFNNSVEYTNERYLVCWPWKSELETLNDKELATVHVRNIEAGSSKQRERLKVLGITWTIKDDKLSMSGPKLEYLVLSSTKREILQSIASIFDPLGIFSPITLLGKLLLQTLWSKKVEWDFKLSENDCDLWKEIAFNIK